MKPDFRKHNLIVLKRGACSVVSTSSAAAPRDLANDALLLLMPTELLKMHSPHQIE